MGRAARTMRRGRARVIVVVAVLAGLFFMHGTATGAVGCHDGASGAAPAAGAMHDEMNTAVVVAHPSSVASQADWAGTDHVVSLDSHRWAGHGQLCSANLPRAVTAQTPAPGALVALLPVLLLLRRVNRRGARTRAPPASGASLLLQLCISRT
ncbi:MAG: hypothetical protein JWN52_275 [Actinomycetia bacterium]|nr:hypothetical protein [Actinomycetes bacterium]